MKEPTLAWALWAAVVALFGLLGAFVRAILKGDLVPRSVLHDEQARADKLETAWKQSEAVGGTFDGRFDAIMEAVELNTKLVSALVERSPRP